MCLIFVNQLISLLQLKPILITQDTRDRLSADLLRSAIFNIITEINIIYLLILFVLVYLLGCNMHQSSYSFNVF